MQNINNNQKNEITEFYQVLVSEKYKNKGDTYYIAEDKGYIFLIFYSLEKFVNFLNKKMKNKFDRF